MSSWGERVWQFLEERYHIRQEVDDQFEQVVPSHATTWPYCLGGLAFLAFLVQLVSGMLLLFYYKPTASDAYQSMEFIMTQVPYGWFVRSIHALGGTVFVVLIILHMIRVFVTGSYKKPREFHWVSGTLALVTTIGLGFTGYLLPWDQVAYWATTVGTEMAASVPPPALGQFLLAFFRGGEQVSGDTLTRFFALHIWFLPAALFLLLVLHFLMIRRTGISGPL